MPTSRPHAIEIPAYLAAVRMLSCLWVLLLLSLCTTTARAQYQFDHWTADNGLPQNAVRDLVQTRDGYLWLATFDGLARFDGVRFTVFNKSNSPGIITNRFINLYEDAHGDLWATTENSGLTRLHQGRFVTYTQENGLPGRLSSGLGGDGFGNLMFFCGAHLFRWMDGKFQPADDLRLPAGGERQSQQNHVLHLPTTSEPPSNFFPSGRMACFANGQLLWWELSDFSFSILYPPVRDSQGNVWFCANEGLIKMTNGRVVKTYTMNADLPGKNPVFVYGQVPLQVLTVRDDRSLWLTELDSMHSRLVIARLPEGRGFPPHLSYMDREGNIWIGTIFDGLYRVRPQSITMYSKPQGLTKTEIYPVLEDRAGTIWVGSDRLFRFKDGAFTNYPRDTIGEPPVITSIFQDRAGEFWVNGIYRIEDGRFVSGISNDILRGAGLVYAMYEDREGAYWIGTEAGVVHYQNGTARRYTTQDGLAGNNTKVIIEDGAGGLWIGSYGGLTHFKDGRFTAWTERDGLPGSTVRALYQDKDGVLWIGTYDGGLGRFKDGRFTRYTLKDGLYGNGVFQILEDAAGWYWMTCNRGIYRVHKQELNDFADGKIKSITSISYGKSDGMLSAECNGGSWPAGVRARDGKLWLPTMDGVAVIDPATITTNEQPPPVMIEAIKIDNEVVTGTTGEPADSALQITPSQENFEIQYTALSFINSEHLRFKYKLEGLDHDWVEAGTRRTAFFSHVPPGQYTFRVIAANSDGVWNTEGKSLRITVLPPFYRTWWFLTLAALVAGGAVFVAFKSRVRQIERRQAAQQAFARQLLESQEAERKRIAAELHDSLGQSLAIIQNSALMGSIASTDLESAKEQFELIAAQSTQAINEARDISYNLRPYLLDRLGLTKALESMIRKVADASGINFTTEITEMDGLFAPEEEINLYRIAQECLNNIVKHSCASAATFRLRREQDWVELIVSDNGKGFPETAFAASVSDGPEQTRRGFGLMGIRERALLFKAVPTLHSTPGEGTTITIRFTRQTTHSKSNGNEQWNSHRDGA